MCLVNHKEKEKSTVPCRNRILGDIYVCGGVVVFFLIINVFPKYTTMSIHYF